MWINQIKEKLIKVFWKGKITMRLDWNKERIYFACVVLLQKYNNDGNRIK